MCEQLTLPLFGPISSAAASPARPCLLPENAKPKRTRAGSGRSSPAWSATYDPTTSSWRTSPDSSRPPRGQPLATCSVRWPRSGTMRNGIASARPMLERRTGESGCSCWPTAWNTPRAEDSECCGAHRTRGTTETLTAQSRGMADAEDGLVSGPGRGPQGRGGAGQAGEAVAYTEGTRREGAGTDTYEGRPGLGDGCDWPPGPDDAAGWQDYLARYPDRAPAVPRVVAGVRGGADGPPRWLDARRRRARLRCLGNSVVSACAEVVGRRLREITDG